MGNATEETLVKTISAQTAEPLDVSSDITSIPTFRALRFDVAGVFKYDTVGGSTGVTRNVAAGETLLYASTCFAKIYSAAHGTTASGIDKLT